jgi:LuxR family maltose regulon positive regulatory protein
MLLERLHAAAAAQGRVDSAIEARALQALALAADGQDKRAMSILTEALTLGYPEGYVRVFADEGAPMRALPGLVEPLTSREQQVLRLLAVGRANRDIAAELVVTLDTVKRHVTHILAKLGAVNRTEAVARARELNLLP